MTLKWRCLLLAAALLCLPACNIDAPQANLTPTLESLPIASQTPPAAMSATPTAPPTPRPTAIDQPTLRIATATPTLTPPPPSPQSSPPATSPFYEYVVQEQDSMFYVIQLPQHGYRYQPEIAATVVALNDSIINMDVLPIGETILIPRPTMTGTVPGANATRQILATLGADDASGAVLDASAVVGCHEVAEDETLVGIALQYDTTLEVLSSLNREINWFGCAFTEPSGGPDCNPNIQIDQCIRVPQPTPLPSRTPTPSGRETATPTATHRAPRLLYPADNATVPAGALRLQWLAISGISAEDEYLIELYDQRTNQPLLQQVSRSSDFQLPLEIAPSDGQTHLIQWRVSVARRGPGGVYAYVGQPGQWRAFHWMSR